MGQKIHDFMGEVAAKHAGETEFLQAVEEVAEAVIPFMEENPKYNNKMLLERMVEPERVLMFRVPWLDDKGETQVNRGYRVEFNSAIGPYKGGSLITADIANSYNREVFAVPGNPTDKNAKGCNYLIKSLQAILLESAADIVKGLNWDVKDLMVQQSMFVDLTDDEQKIIEILSNNEMHIDALVEALNWGFSKVASVLLKAEFKGLIISLPGKIYKKSS